MNPEYFKEVLDNLAQMPLGLLYTALGGLSALENIIPPLPTDLFVAFGAFLAARGKGDPWLTFTVCFIGNMVGAGFTFYLGRKYGPSILAGSKFAKLGGVNAEIRILKLYEKYGVIALFVSRFLPGVRAMVPPVVGALRFQPVRCFLAFGSASALWYAFVTVLAFRAGNDFDKLYERIVQSGKYVSFGAAGLVLLALAIWIIRHYLRDKEKRYKVGKK